MKLPDANNAAKDKGVTFAFLGHLWLFFLRCGVKLKFDQCSTRTVEEIAELKKIRNPGGFEKDN